MHKSKIIPATSP